MLEKKIYKTKNIIEAIGLLTREFEKNYGVKPNALVMSEEIEMYFVDVLIRAGKIAEEDQYDGLNGSTFNGLYCVVHDYLPEGNITAALLGHIN